MKKIILLFVCVFSLTLNAQNTSYNWSSDYLSALDIAKNQNKTLVLIFVNPNNSESEKLIQSEVLDSKEFEAMASELILLKVYPIGLDGITNQQKAYSKRLIGHYNPGEQFPGITTVATNGQDTASLFGEINSTSVKTFIESLKSL